MSSFSEDSCSEDEFADSAARVCVDRFFQNCLQEKWTTRFNYDGAAAVVPRKSKKHKAGNLFETIRDDDYLLLAIASFLDPHDMMEFASSCKSFWKISQSDAGWKTRLQSIFQYFRFSQTFVDQLIKMTYNWKSVIRFFTLLTKTMQGIYGREYNVHPIHRFLVSQWILGELCGQGYTPPDEPDDDNPDPPRFHPRAPKRKLSPNLFYTEFHRFNWCVVMGDGHYSFTGSHCREYGHGLDFIDFDSREDVLEDEGVVYVYMYQEEDNFKVRGITNRDPTSGSAGVNLWIRAWSSDDGDERKEKLEKQQGFLDYKSLAHYYVLGEHRGDLYSPPSSFSKLVIERLLYLHTHQLLDRGSLLLDWATILPSVGIGTDVLQSATACNSEEIEPGKELDPDFGPFPVKLFLAFNEGDELSDALFWNDAGTVFGVKPQAFLRASVSPDIWEGTRFEDFQVKLCDWGFAITNEDNFPLGTVAYQHEYFQRSMPDLVNNIKKK